MKDTKSTDQLLRPYEVAKIFGVTPRTVRRWVAKGKIEHVRTPGEGIRIPKRELEKLFKIMKTSC